MLRVYLRFIGVSVLIFTATLMLIRTQPYDERELRQTLFPAGCPAPCFLGIRPGVTTTDEAVRLLKQSGWVDGFEFILYNSQLKIRWNQHSPSWLTNDGAYGGPVIWIEHGHVSEFRIDTNLTLGRMQLLLGVPAYQNLYIDNRKGYKYLFYSALYTDSSMFTSVINDCHGAVNRFSYQDKIYLGYTQLSNIYDLPHTYRSSWADLMRVSCR